MRSYNLNIIEHVFPDHYLYHKDDFDFGDALPIIMTEKDAVKCKSFADERFWYFPVVANLSRDFGEALIEKLNVLKKRKK